jgi:hypothetical protein
MAKRTTSGSPSRADDAAASAPVTRRSSRSRAQAGASGRAAMTAAGEDTTGAEDAGADTPSEDDIRLRAYHRYLERGGGHGMDFQDWLEAERELRGKK